MHEVSLVRGVFRSLEEEFNSDQLAKMHTIRMKIGLLSNVEPVLMQSAFNAVKEDNPQYANVNLDIESIPIEVHCDICGKDSVVSNYRFVCDCGVPTNNVVKGQELLIHQVEFLD